MNNVALLFSCFFLLSFNQVLASIQSFKHPEYVDFILKQKKTIVDTVSPLLPLSNDIPFAMFDFPMHPNFGDSAIWAGEIEVQTFYCFLLKQLKLLVENNLAALFKDQFYPPFEFYPKFEVAVEDYKNKTGKEASAWWILSHVFINLLNFNNPSRVVVILVMFGAAIIIYV